MTGTLEILDLTRGKIRVSAAGRTITLSGEGMPAGNPVDFYADLASIIRWDDGSAVSEADRAMIVRELPAAAQRRGLTVRVD